MSFQSSAWIKRSAHVVRAQILNRAYGCAHANRPGIQPEIDKTTLERQERMNRAMAAHDFRAKEPMQNLDVAGYQRDGPSLREGLSESLFEVVAHLSFEHDVRKRLVPRARSEEHTSELQ